LTTLTLTDMIIASGAPVAFGAHIGARGPLVLVDTAISGG